MPPEGAPLEPKDLAMLSKWIEGGVLQAKGSVAKASNKPNTGASKALISTTRKNQPSWKVSSLAKMLTKLTKTLEANNHKQFSSCSEQERTLLCCSPNRFNLIPSC